ncbi:MAG: 50S ribosomal protein L30 [Deltaproteobacteria bacterium]|nr:MAG: 50S ribosomal protein L30 [Deltaproteobacteria bacterium]
MAGKLRLTLKKSRIGKLPRHRQILDGLGLKRRQQVVEREDTPAIRGMVEKVRYLLDVEQI